MRRKAQLKQLTVKGGRFGFSSGRFRPALVRREVADIVRPRAQNGIMTKPPTRVEHRHAPRGNKRDPRLFRHVGRCLSRSRGRLHDCGGCLAVAKDLSPRTQSSRLAEFGGRGRSFNICASRASDVTHPRIDFTQFARLTPVKGGAGASYVSAYGWVANCTSLVWLRSKCSLERLPRFSGF
jgi:hypothetical protein